MKKFFKTFAVLMALAMVMACFTACSNNSDSGNTQQIDDSAYEGLWINDAVGGGYYIMNGKVYTAAKDPLSEGYCYTDPSENPAGAELKFSNFKIKYTVSGNKLIGRASGIEFEKVDAIPTKLDLSY